MTQPNSFWTPENINRAVSYWMEGCTFAEMAQHLGEFCTKNMVIGLAKRNRDKFPQRDLTEIDLDFLQSASRLWMDGYSVSRIADELCVSKSSISGKIHRNREYFPAREKSVESKNRSLAKTKPRVKKAVTVSETPKLHAKFNGTKRAVYCDPVLDEFELSRLPGLSFMENNGCMYPLTDQSPHMFCGHSRFGGKRYCEHHVQKTKGYSGIDFGYRERYDRNIVRTPVEA